MGKDICVNRKARHEYIIEETLEAGLALKGTEIKSLRNGRASFNDAYVSFKNGQALLKGLHISAYEFGNINNHDEDREKVLLLHKKEIARLFSKSKMQGYSIIPLKLYFNRSYVKVELAIAKGKNTRDKRESDKIRTMEKEAAKAMKR